MAVEIQINAGAYVPGELHVHELLELCLTRREVGANTPLFRTRAQTNVESVGPPPDCHTCRVQLVCSAREYIAVVLESADFHAELYAEAKKTVVRVKKAEVSGTDETSKLIHSIEEKSKAATWTWDENR